MLLQLLESFYVYYGFLTLSIKSIYIYFIFSLKNISLYENKGLTKANSQYLTIT